MCITPSVLFVKNYQFSIPRRSANVQYVYQSLLVSKPGMNFLLYKYDDLPVRAFSAVLNAKIVKLPE